MLKAIKFGAVVVAVVYVCGFIGETIGSADIQFKPANDYYSKVESAIEGVK